MGGGSIRAAAKAAMVGGYRSAAAVRRAILPPQSPHSSAADSRHASTFAVDEWVIPEREVFGPVPTREEASAAALDLRDAFEIVKVESHIADPKTHLSPSDLDDHTKVAQESAFPELVLSENSVHPETPKQEDSYENLLVTSGAPGPVVQAFTLLHESPEVQDVVASLASDKNVWDAVMKNEEVMKFYKTYETKFSDCSSVTTSVTENEVEDGEAASSEFSPSAGESLKDYVEKMKALLSEIVTNLSSMMQDLVATSNEGRCKGKLKTMIMSSSKDFANAPSAFVLLAIASIVVVLLKRA
ncbi:uncharacterized protein LOC133914442 [Phragmites australis]|uniref:uncharacterized protein LOC133914442 n=1 Tax=Phragmites australis TaxID=29695 RepID=UPI002D79B845|nr:uncharacterized protein LOC133914442 [Phragmites australis]